MPCPGVLEYFRFYQQSLSCCPGLRALDSELRTHMKANDASFDYKKLSFLMEASGVIQEEHVLTAQSSVANARKQSLAAAYQLFQTNLENDQVQHEKFLASAEANASRTKTIMIQSLEDTVEIVAFQMGDLWVIFFPSCSCHNGMSQNSDTPFCQVTVLN